VARAQGVRLRLRRPPAQRSLPKLDALLFKKTYDRATEAALGCLGLALHEQHYRLQGARFANQRSGTPGRAHALGPGQQH